MTRVRQAVLAIVEPTPEQRRRWWDLSGEVRDMTNTIWQDWLSWHRDARTRERMIAHLRRLETISTPDRPRDELEAIPKELMTRIIGNLDLGFPRFHSRTRDLVRRRVTREIVRRKSAKGALPGWRSILLGNEQLPSFVRPCEIPFDSRNSRVLPPSTSDGHYRVELRLERSDGHTTRDTVMVWSRGRKADRAVGVLRNLLSGAAKFHGSSVFRREDGAWCVRIHWSGPPEPKPKLDPSRTAVLRPRRRAPWALWVGPTAEEHSHRLSPGGSGRHVEHVRRRLLTSRWGRAEAYRIASSSRRGHGRRRAMAPATIFQNHWRHFVRSLNHLVTKDVVSWCVQAGVGSLVYFQPVGNAESRFLSTAGKDAERRDPTGWDWGQVAAMLAYKCKDAGIDLTIRKSSEPRDHRRIETNPPPESVRRPQGRKSNRKRKPTGG